jgi:hypothetical protein
MSKWIDNSLFEKFSEAKVNEVEQQPADGGRKFGLVWKNPEMGTPDRPKIYEVRFLPDPEGVFYKKYHYHMFRSGEKWNFVLCEKTFDFNNFCPWCHATQQLWMGTKQDKEAAKNYSRKDKYTGNIFVVEDPRDAEVPVEEEDKKVSGKVRIYDFPGKLESKLKGEITDKKNGLGALIFDPGEDGYNFIIKVKSTKPTGDDKKVWPDYSDSVFARRPSALGSDDKIKEIMGSRFKIREYLEAMKRTPEETMALLNQEMLWEMVEKEFSKHFNVAVTVEPTSQTEPVMPEATPVEEVSSAQMSDEDLLKELENI